MLPGHDSRRIFSKVRDQKPPEHESIQRHDEKHQAERCSCVYLSPQQRERGSPRFIVHNSCGADIILSYIIFYYCVEKLLYDVVVSAVSSSRRCRRRRPARRRPQSRRTGVRRGIRHGSVLHVSELLPLHRFAETILSVPVSFVLLACVGRAPRSFKQKAVKYRNMLTSLLHLMILSSILRISK